MKIIPALFSFFLIAFPLNDRAYAIGGDDPVPWPFAIHCPTYWPDISGTWSIVDSSKDKMFFYFQVIRQMSTGEKIIDVQQYDNSSNLIAEGRGLTSANQTVIRFFMSNPQDRSKKPKIYSAFVGRYLEKDKSSCERDRILTVITIRSYSPINRYYATPDDHYILEKVAENNESNR